MIIVVMGVSGSGKTTIGNMLSEALKMPFYDADDFHSDQNKLKMQSGNPLTDEDRKPWLQNIAHQFKLWQKDGAVLACSALKEQYRIYFSQHSKIHWVYLKGTKSLILGRLKQRKSHFMPSTLLDTQISALEEPKNAIVVGIESKPHEICKSVLEALKSIKLAEFGVLGLGVMGRSLATNLLNKGVKLAVYNKMLKGEEHVVDEFTQIFESSKVIGSTTLKHFVQSIKQPRQILCMLPAGEITDEVINSLTPLLDKGDVILDGANSHYTDTIRREKELTQKKIEYIGLGVSGGEKGALTGPSLMPGGQIKTYNKVAPYLELMAAKDQSGKPCCSLVGLNGAGHFVKMVHNGIEYAEMQLLAEVYAMLKMQFSNDDISVILKGWLGTDLDSYLLEITSEILIKKEGEQYLLDLILDKAGNKGTGSWSSQAALQLGVPNDMMIQAVMARYISAFKEVRNDLSKHSKKINNPYTINLEALEKAYRFARKLNHLQGFWLIKEASKKHQWGIKLSELARIWTNGCIIKSELMKALSLSLTDENLFKNSIFFSEQREEEEALSNILRHGITHRIYLPCYNASWQFWISLTSNNLSTNLIQAQRDYFGAHTYQRVDRDASLNFHTKWEE